MTEGERLRMRALERLAKAAGVAMEHWREAALFTGHNRPGVLEMARRATAEYDAAGARLKRLDAGAVAEEVTP